MAAWPSSYASYEAATWPKCSMVQRSSTFSGSCSSGADFALAIVDEIERAARHRVHVLVAH